MHHEIPELDARGLRGFAFKMACAIALVFGVVLPWLFEYSYPLWPWIVAAVLSAWGLIAPSTLNPVYRGWMHVGLAVGAINSRIILGLVFFVIIAPAGFLMRALGKDPMLRSLHTDSPSYRVKSRPSRPKHVEKPY